MFATIITPFISLGFLSIYHLQKTKTKTTKIEPQRMVCQITYLNAANFRSNEFLYEKQQNCNAIVLGTHISVCADHFIFNISSSLNHSLTIFGMAAGAVTPQFNSSSSTDNGNFRQNFTKQISISIRTIFPPPKKTRGDTHFETT